MKKPSEQQLKKQIVEYLNLTGKVFCFPTNTGTFFFTNKQGKTRVFKSGVKGMPDILGIISGGLFLTIEVKIGYNKPTPEQKEFLDKIRSMGGIAMWVTSLDEVIENLKDYVS